MNLTPSCVSPCYCPGVFLISMNNKHTMPKKMDEASLKRYYSIGEVAKMFGVSKSLIRFWESEFDFLRPHKNSKGDRRFTKQNLEQMKLIYHLVRERGFTLEGAKRELKRLKEVERERTAVVDRLEALKGFLESLRKEI